MTNHPLRLWRTLSKLSATAFGARVGVSKFAISDYERRRRFPSPGVLAAIERETGGFVTASAMLAAYQSVGAPPQRAAPTPPPPGRIGAALLPPPDRGSNSISKTS